MTTIAPKISILDSTLAELTARLTQALDRADRLEKTLERVAKGTTPPAMSEVPAQPLEKYKAAHKAPRPSAELVEKALRLQPCDTATLAGRMGLPVSPTLNMLRTLQRDGRVVNVGTTAKPVWCWVIGDETSTAELLLAVSELIKIKPISLKELMIATGARIGRVSGCIVRFQRLGADVQNRGTGRRARWYLPSN